MMLAGRYLHQLLLSEFNYDLTDDLELIVVGIIFVSVLPILYKLLQNKLKEMKEAKQKDREN
jgi:membrane-associated protein